MWWFNPITTRQSIAEQIQDGDAVVIAVLKSLQNELNSRSLGSISIATIKEQLPLEIDKMLSPTKQ